MEAALEAVVWRGYEHRVMHRVRGIDWALLGQAVRERSHPYLEADWVRSSCLAIIMIRIVSGGVVGIWIDTPQEHLERPRLKRAARSVFLRWLLRRLDVVFATGDPACRMVTRMGARADRTVNLPWTIDLEGPKLVRSEESSRRAADSLRAHFGTHPHIVFSMIGRLDWSKGFDLGLRALAEVVARGHLSANLIVAGDGPEREVLTKMATRLGVADRVHFLGWVEPEDLEPVYLASDVVMHPARSDPYPIVVLEAMAWGLPIVATEACGNIEDRVSSGVNGYSIPVDDVDALADAMIDLASDQSLRDRVGLAARKTAEAWPQSRGVEILARTIQRLWENP